MKPFENTSKKKIFTGICALLLVLVLLSFVYTARNFGNQSKNAMYPVVRFSGMVKTAEGPWTPYVYGKHIPADKGAVTLKGDFLLLSPVSGEILDGPYEGTSIAFYLNHLQVKISENGEEAHVFDTELDMVSEDMCGVMYIGYDFHGKSPVTITLTNPHRFGNAKAVDDFLNNIFVYGGTDFENDMLSRGNLERNWGIVLILSAFMLLGTALFAFLIHMKSNRILCLVGFTVFFAGLYFMFSAHGVMFFSEIVKFNTRMHGASMMLYMLSLTAFLADGLPNKTRRLGQGITLVILLSVITFFIVPMATNIKFYDLLPLWAIIQSVSCIIMTALLAHYFSSGEKNNEFVSAFGMLPMISFLIDCIGTYFGFWRGGLVSKIVFSLLFLISIIWLLRVIPQSINAALRARELEAEREILKAELTESRIATMISQIQPHFIYNTLGTIEQLCITEPEAASSLVRNFSLYLRGNFSELDNAKPIMFSQEMNHVKHYTDIEQVRFPDMTIQYDLRSVEFLLPALSVQPLVENAIKHGLMGLEEGGIVTISAYETEKFFIVEVTDDGVGFDTEAGYDEKKHVGIKNIRGRIEAMCNGTLSIESTPGKGTQATIKIPKEAKEDDSNNS